MNDHNSFKDIYAHLAPELATLEQWRSQAAWRLWLILLPLTLGTIFVSVCLNHFNPFVGRWGMIGCVVGMAIIYRRITNDFINSFKDKVIAPMIQFISPNLYYGPHDFVSRKYFNGSRIFRMMPNSYHGSDGITGREGDTVFECSEIHASYDISGGGHSSVKKIFDGLFFAADFNKHFKGRTFILPNKTGQVFGSGMGNVLKSESSKYGERIRLEDPEFESYFQVYGDDQVEARYILSPGLMARLTELRKKAAMPMFVSFSDSLIHIAIGYKRPIFEPHMFRRLDRSREIRRFFDDLNLALGIVEDLNLNTRIWTK